MLQLPCHFYVENLEEKKAVLQYLESLELGIVWNSKHLPTKFNGALRFYPCCYLEINADKILWHCERNYFKYPRAYIPYPTDISIQLYPL